VPFFFRCIADLTFFAADFPYFAMLASTAVIYRNIPPFSSAESL
jgi:hypothetical protein